MGTPIFFLFMVAAAAYGSSQAKGQIGAAQLAFVPFLTSSATFWSTTRSAYTHALILPIFKNKTGVPTVALWVKNSTAAAQVAVEVLV